jgi:hypothetical protein
MNDRLRARLIATPPPPPPRPLTPERPVHWTGKRVGTVVRKMQGQEKEQWVEDWGEDIEEMISELMWDYRVRHRMVSSGSYQTGSS